MAASNTPPENGHAESSVQDISFSDAEHRRVVIVGAGPAGYTAALYNARADLEPLVFQGPEPGGQLMTTTDVENYPGFPEGVLGPDMMQKFEEQAERFGAETRFGVVTAVDLSERPFRIVVDEETPLLADSLIVASGASARHLGLEREDELMGYGLSTCATCDGAFHRGDTVLVVGGGDSAMEEATFLTKFAEKVYILHRREEFRASEIMKQRAFDNEKIEILKNTEMIALKGTREDGITGATIVTHPDGYPKRRYEDGDDTVEVQDFECQGVFYAIGHDPNTEYLQDTGLEMDEDGYIPTRGKRTSRTNIDGVFVAGDVSDHVYQQAVTAAGMGCMAAIDAERFLSEEEHAAQREKAVAQS
jgi:thioredoxin reductase (NADPH)